VARENRDSPVGAARQTRRKDAHYHPTALPKIAPFLLLCAHRQIGPKSGKCRCTGYPHRLRADEPVAVGGADSGPSPYDLLLAGLGACTAMTVQMYADHKQLPLHRVSVDLNHDKVHAADCEECETREGKVDRIECVLTLEGDLDEAQHAKLLEIANKCPVHRTLHSEVWIPTRLAEAT
jgi:uncharacterized OsmC-like protein